MLRVKVKKLWQGRFASIRDYQLNQAKKKGGLIVTFDDGGLVSISYHIIAVLALPSCAWCVV